MEQQDLAQAQLDTAHETDTADRRRAVWRGRRNALAVALTLALILSIAGMIVAQPGFWQQRVDDIPGVASAPRTATLVATAGAEAPANGWSKLWAYPIPAAQRNGANPSLAWSPAQPETLYLCLYGEPLLSTAPKTPHSPLLYRSADGSKTWRALALPEPATRCAIYPDPSTPGRIALIDDHGATYLSDDAGGAWQAIPPPPDVATYGARFEAIVAGRLYVGADWTSDLHVWTRWFFGQPVALSGAPVVDPRRPKTLYLIQRNCVGAPSTSADAANGVCRSDDGGHTWRWLISTSAAPGPAPTVCLAPGRPDTLFVWAPELTVGGVTVGSFARSVDGGATWTTAGLPQESQPPAFSPATSCSVSGGFYGSPLGGEDSVRDDGAIYTTVAPGDSGSRPSGVIVYRDGAWHVVAPAPLRANPYAPPAVVWLPQPDGRYVLLAVSDGALYRYNATVAG